MRFLFRCLALRRSSHPLREAAPTTPQMETKSETKQLRIPAVALCAALSGVRPTKTRTRFPLFQSSLPTSAKALCAHVKAPSRTSQCAALASVHQLLCTHRNVRSDCSGHFGFAGLRALVCACAKSEIAVTSSVNCSDRRRARLAIHSFGLAVANEAGLTSLSNFSN
jgi:hypothetical protein